MAVAAAAAIVVAVAGAAAAQGWTHPARRACVIHKSPWIPVFAPDRCADPAASDFVFVYAPNAFSIFLRLCRVASRENVVVTMVS